MTSPRTRQLDDTTTTLAKLTDGFPSALQRLLDARRGYPGANAYDGTGGGPSTGSPVERTALTPDPVGSERAQLDAVLNRLARDTTWLAGFVARWTPHAPTTRDRLAVDRANHPDPTCDHCTPWRPKGTVWPVHATGTVAGNLDLPLALCEWCYGRVRRTGALPTRRQVEDNTLGKPVPIRV